MRVDTLNRIELHDARLTALSSDYALRKVVVDVDYYSDPVHASERVSARIVFEKVKSLSQIVDFMQMKTNAAAGNVTNWWPNADGKTYLYLAGGCVIVESKK